MGGGWEGRRKLVGWHGVYCWWRWVRRAIVAFVGFIVVGLWSNR